jgi:hypothetical protein
VAITTNFQVVPGVPIAREGTATLTLNISHSSPLSHAILKPPLLLLRHPKSRHHTLTPSRTDSRLVEADLCLPTTNRQAGATMADDGEIAPNATFVHCTPYEPARGQDYRLIKGIRPQPRRERQDPGPDRSAARPLRRVRHHRRHCRQKEPQAQGPGLHHLRQCGQRAERHRRPAGLRPVRAPDELGLCKGEVGCYGEEGGRRCGTRGAQEAKTGGEGYVLDIWRQAGPSR